MNARELDIHTLISAHGPLTSAQLQDYLTQPRYGYNLEVEQISKIASKMKSHGLLTGEDRPNPGTKPVRYWALPEVVNQEMTTDVSYEVVTAIPPEHYAEFASDKAKLEQGEWSDAMTFECQPDKTQEMPEQNKAQCVKNPMSVPKALDAFAETGLAESLMPAFMDGIAAAERHHGIAE